MCLAVLHQQSGFEPSDLTQDTEDSAVDDRLAQLYRGKTAQCLVLGNYTKPSRYVYETLLLYMNVEYFRSKDAQTGLWILLGITIPFSVAHGVPPRWVRFLPNIAVPRRDVSKGVVHSLHDGCWRCCIIWASKNGPGAAI